MSKIFMSEYDRGAKPIVDRILKKFGDEEKKDKILIRELETILYDRKMGITPTQFRTLTALLECKSFKEVAYRLSEDEGKDIKIDTLRRRATRTRQKLLELLDKRIRENHGV